MYHLENAKKLTNESIDMLWEIIKNTDFVIYKNKSMDLRAKVIEDGDFAKVHIDYKGYNIVIPMMFWEFSDFLALHSIDVDIEDKGKKAFFVVNIDKLNLFLDDIFFFLLDNNMDAVLREEYKL